MSIDSKAAKLLVALPLAATALGSAPQPGVAQERGGLANLVSDLYGGDGITLVNPDHEAHFEAQGQQELLQLSDDISRNIAFAPFNSSASSIVFDFEQGVPVRTLDSLGPVLLQRAKTIGAGRANFGVSYTRVDYQQFEGDDLKDLELELEHIDCCSANPTPPPPFDFDTPDGVIGPPGPTFELDTIVLDLDLELEQDIFAFFGTYGITDNWDVGAVVPVVHVEGSVRSRGRIRNFTEDDDMGPFGPNHEFTDDPTAEDFPIDSNEDDATGIGDILLRTKYNFLEDQGDIPDMSVLGQLTLPTGDEDDLLGTGELGTLGLFILSQDFGRFTPHLNIGYEVFTGDVEDNLRYGVGTEVMVTDQITGIAEIFGRYEPGGDGTGDLVDAVLGAKWNPFGDAVASANFIIPINKDTGLRADFIWGVGVEISF